MANAVTSLSWLDFMLRSHKFLVLVFYRGDFCPFCKAYMQGFSLRTKAIEKEGGMVVGISAQSARRNAQTQKAWGVSFPFFSDSKNLLARRFNVCISPQIGFPHGMCQPAVVAVDDDWRRPSRGGQERAAAREEEEEEEEVEDSHASTVSISDSTRRVMSTVEEENDDDVLSSRASKRAAADIHAANAIAQQQQVVVPGASAANIAPPKAPKVNTLVGDLELRLPKRRTKKKGAAHSKKKRDILYWWALAPNLVSGYGAIGRIHPERAWEQIREALFNKAMQRHLQKRRQVTTSVAAPSTTRSAALETAPPAEVKMSDLLPAERCDTQCEPLSSPESSVSDAVDTPPLPFTPDPNTPEIWKGGMSWSLYFTSCIPWINNARQLLVCCHCCCFSQCCRSAPVAPKGFRDVSAADAGL